MSKAPQPTASGILLVDKPQGLTSHDVVSRARRFVGTRKIGHAGTLDPMATGLLILGVNSSTRLLTYLVGLGKEYTATIRLGISSSTDDAEGELSDPADAELLSAITDEQVAAGVASLTGDILQRPSSVSAIKVDGQRAYARVRAGEDVILDARPVTIHAFEVLHTTRTDHIDLQVRVECSSGTYIRALARDLGDYLGVGGHLTELRRTRVGPFEVTHARALDEDLSDGLIAPTVIARALFDAVELDDTQATELSQGKRIALEGSGGPIAAIDRNDKLLGLVEISGGRARVLVNFPTGEATA